MSDYNFDYGEIYTLMRKFKNLTKDEVRIMDYLMQHDYVEATYSGLTDGLELENCRMSNIRKALLHLEKMGIVYIVRAYDEDEKKRRSNNPMRACYIVDGWMYAFLIGGWDKVGFRKA